MINLHDLITGGTIGGPLMVIAIVLVYFAFFRDTRSSRK